MTDRAPLGSPGVRFPPPLLFIGGLVVSWLLDRQVHPLPLGHERELAATFGMLLLAVGLALMAWGMITFRGARTAIVPMHGASRLVVHGPYRFTRNPMYTGFTFAYLGIALILNSAWPLLALPIVLALLVRMVIRREEAYLADAFGAEYSAYRQRVRRWL